MKTREELDQYVSTGIIEAYVLGILPSAEMQEFERQVVAHPQLQKQLSDAETLLKPLIKAEKITGNRQAGVPRRFMVEGHDEDYRRAWLHYRQRQQKVYTLNKRFKLLVGIGVALSVIYILATLFFFIFWKKA